MLIRSLLAALLLVTAVSAPLVAHHSFAATFDASKAIRGTGTLAKVGWTNPHIYFYVDVTEDKGMVVPRLSNEWRQHFPSLPEDVAEPA